MTRPTAAIEWDTVSVIRADSSSQYSPKLLRNIKSIIFDFDGTLYDNALLPIKLIAKNPFDAARLWKERLLRKKFQGCDFGSPEKYQRAFFSALGKMCFRKPEKIKNWYFNRYMPRMIHVLKKHYKPREGAVELIKHFERKQKIAIYSDYPRLKERLEALGFFTGENVLLYGPETFGAQKPAPRPFIQIARDLGLSPKEVLVIGDRENTDGLGAFHAGMRFFCLETGGKKYLTLDPNRRPEKQTPHGPALLMYAGVWNDLLRVLMEK